MHFLGGFIPLICKERIVSILIENGEYVNSKNIDGSTALFEAAIYGHEEIPSLLIKNGADVNSHTINGSTALVV